ncbi:hypothetical protein [Polaribacter tangerinus]|uniref:hypothetical protein n=1 Tax=Polaribacter tangerinus TaxID=1920034 RepID=UPI00117C1788|nr:hypothetical protein [Polaribacter tangerinus]
MKYLFAVITIIGFVNCKSHSIQTKTPFKVVDAFYFKEIGFKENTKDFTLEIQLTQNTNQYFDSIFYKNKKTKILTIKTGKITRLLGYFKHPKKTQNLIMDANSIKELKNTIPAIEKSPFKLKENEAIISYFVGKKKKYFKIKSVKKRFRKAHIIH